MISLFTSTAARTACGAFLLTSALAGTAFGQAQRQTAKMEPQPIKVVEAAVGPTPTPCNSNAINNPSFETQPGSSGPTRIDNMNGGYYTTPGDPATAPPPSEVSFWSSTTEGTPDYFSENATNSQVKPSQTSIIQNWQTNPPVYGFTPHTGNSAIGLLNNDYNVSGNDQRYYEYATSILRNGGLTANRAYYGSMYVQPAPSSGFVASKFIQFLFGMSFTATNPTQKMGPYDSAPLNSGKLQLAANSNSYILSASPINAPHTWQRIHGSFVAAGGEKYVTVGLFAGGTMALQPGNTDQTLGAYTLVDDVNLWLVPKAITPQCPDASGTLTLKADACDNIPGATYSWSGPNGFSSTQFAPTLTNPTKGEYGFVVHLPNGQTYGSSAQVQGTGDCPTFPGLKAQQQPELSVYPNPAHGQLNINLKNVAQSVTAEIYNQRGLLVQQVELRDAATVDTRSLKPGIYLLRVNAAGQSIQKRFSVE